MDGPRECHISEVKSDGEGEILDGITYTWNLKINDTNELIYKAQIDSQTWRMNLWLSGGRLGRRNS